MPDSNLANDAADTTHGVDREKLDAYCLRPIESQQSRSGPRHENEYDSKHEHESCFAEARSLTSDRFTRLRTSPQAPCTITFGSRIATCDFCGGR
jgi:hypothetical protein